jgi:hemoglobin
MNRPLTAALSIAALAALPMFAAACGEDGDNNVPDVVADTTSDTTNDTTDTVAGTTPCERAGGANAVSAAVYDPANAGNAATLVGAFAADCRVNTFFTSLPAAQLDHVGQCLAIQVQELFGCDVTYAGSTDRAGAPCRDMKTTHAGLAISTGDFDALIEDIVAFATPLHDAGVLTDAELAATSAALLGMRGDIVEQAAVTTPTKKACNPCDRIGGTEAVKAAVYDPTDATNESTLVGRFAADCSINTFFVTLTAEALNHTGECLAIQVAELMGCDVTYAGSMDSLGAPCRDMKTTHAGLAISQGDFDALLADIVAFVTPLAQAGLITSAELSAASAVLVGLGPDIVEQPEVETTTMADCPVQ